MTTKEKIDKDFELWWSTNGCYIDGNHYATAKQAWFDALLNNNVVTREELHKHPPRVFGPKDFPPGTVLRPGGWDKDGYISITGLSNTEFTTWSDTAYKFCDINSGTYKGSTFSTDGGKTWQRMEP